MAIKKGIAPGAVLWKQIDYERVRVYNRDLKKFVFQEFPIYKALILNTRRARINGATIHNSLYPLLEALNINLTSHIYNNHSIAIGTAWVQYSEEDWNALEVPEEVSKWYFKLGNKSLDGILEKASEEAQLEVLQKMKVEEDTSEEFEWPEEPEFREQRPFISGNHYMPAYRW